MIKSLKVRIYPNKKQEELIIKTFGYVRYVYNYYLDKRIKQYKNCKKSLSYNECSKDLTSLKKELEWLKEPDKFSLQSSLKNLDEAYKRFFNNLGRFPKFKSKNNKKDSYTTKFTNNNIEIFESHIKLPKLGKIKYRDNSIIKGKISNVTVLKTKTGKYFAAITYEKEEKPLEKTGSSIGIDLGLKYFCVFSNGEKKKNPKYYASLQDKLIREQRKLSRMQKLALDKNRKLEDCKNYQKQKLKVARVHERIVNKRCNFLNKLTSNIVKNHDIICLENLNVKGMLKNKKLAKSISDVSWYEFIRKLTYKAKWYGKELVIIDRWFSSSKTCHICGYKKKDLQLKDRSWVCPICKTTHDRDINAAINILNEGLRLLSA